MTQKLLFVFCLITATAVICLSQTRTVTNSDLEKYRRDRIKAEADLRENYARLGFPSPEERARRDAQAAKEREELSARLKKEELERERIEAARAAGETRAAQTYYYRLPQRAEILPQFYNTGFTYYYWWNGNWYPIPRIIVPYQQPGYFAGGMFIPTGPSQQPRPLIRIGRRLR